MTRKYHLVLHSPMGPRDGTLTMEEDCGTVTGTLSILDHQLPVTGSRGADGEVRLTHRIVTSVSEYPCRSVLRDAGGTVSGELRMDQTGALWGCSRYQTETVMPWSGEELT